MKLQLVTHETAIMLEKAGFDWKCYHVYDEQIIHELEHKIKNDYQEYIVEQKGNNWEYIEKSCGLKSLNEIINANPSFTGYTLIPSQALAHMWLRENHRIHIVINPINGLDSWNYFIYAETITAFKKISSSRPEIEYQSYGQALECAIQECCQYIIS